MSGLGAPEGKMTREGVNGKVTFEQRAEGGERVTHTDAWGKSSPGTRNSQCKGPEVGMCLTCLRRHEEGLPWWRSG